MVETDGVILDCYNEENDLKIFCDIMDSYNFILDLWIKLFEELNVVKSIDICNFVSYLLYNGFFSKDKVLYYQFENRLNTPKNYALDIMNGNGVCLNYSCLLNDFLKKKQFFSSVISLKFRNTKSNYSPNIKFNSVELSNYNQESKNIFNNIFKIFEYFFGSCDHASTLVCDNNIQYIYDITNLEYLKLKNFWIAELIGGIGYHKLNYRFNYETAKSFLECNINDSFNIFALEEIKKNKEYFYPSEEVIINSWERTNDLFNSNILLLNDCYFETKKDIDKIADYIEEKKKIKQLVKKQPIN